MRFSVKVRQQNTNMVHTKLVYLAILMLAAYGAEAKPKKEKVWSRGMEKKFMKLLLKDFKKHNELGNGTQYVYKPGDDQKTCPLPDPQGPGLDTQSTCPWVPVKNINEDRYPRTLSDVKCLCSECIANKGMKYKCQKIEIEVPVFYRLAGGKLDVRTEKIGTGCTCAVSDVIEPPPISRRSSGTRRHRHKH